MLVPDLNVNVFRIKRTSLKDPLMQFFCFFLSRKKRLQDTCGRHLGGGSHWWLGGRVEGGWYAIANALRSTSDHDFDDGDGDDYDDGDDVGNDDGDLV